MLFVLMANKNRDPSFTFKNMNYVVNYKICIDNSNYQDHYQIENPEAKELYEYNM